jgi:hypothetical protein
VNVGFDLDVGSMPCSLGNVAFLHPSKDYYILSGLAISRSGLTINGLRILG